MPISRSKKNVAAVERAETKPVFDASDLPTQRGVEPVGFDKYFELRNPDTGEVIGKIHYPSEFCDGLSCQLSSGEKHPLSFRRVGFTWVHIHCGKPTREYASATFRDYVDVPEDVKLPWEENEEL
ncbi:MAG TPA: hypothetical protein VLG09_04765 [Candidatus Saccharimonadales bacterium]|nr:hypothetical protein [Candidatus Saccharimonadales bacterium]